MGVGTSLDLLGTIQNHNGARVTEVATEMGIANSTAHRHLSTLLSGNVNELEINLAYSNS